MSDEPRPDNNVLWQQSGVNPEGEPFVQLLYGDRILAQLAPEDARDYATNILQCTEAAEQDAFIYDWVVNRVKAGPEQAAGLLVDFRKYRMERTGKRGGPSDKRDWVMPDEPSHRDA